MLLKVWGICTRNVLAGNRIHLSNASAISDAKRNHLFVRSIPSKRKKGDDMKSRGIFMLKIAKSTVGGC